MCARCDEMAGELRRRHSLATAIVKELDELLEIAERPDADPIDMGDEIDEDDPISLMERNLEHDDYDDDPAERVRPSANGRATRAASAQKASERGEDLQELAEKCAGFIRSEGGKLAHQPLRNWLAVHHKTADAAIRRAVDQKLIVSEKIDGLSYYVLPTK